MKGTGSFNLPLEALSPAVLVSDIVYTPLETKLLADAKGLGLRTVDGLGMLLHQAVPGFSAWFGTVPEVTKDLRDHMILKLENK
jgi:shikimate dehydrogenase